MDNKPTFPSPLIRLHLSPMLPASIRLQCPIPASLDRNGNECLLRRSSIHRCTASRLTLFLPPQVLLASSAPLTLTAYIISNFFCERPSCWWCSFSRRRLHVRQSEERRTAGRRAGAQRQSETRAISNPNISNIISLSLRSDTKGRRKT